jgi:hypothetical protein
MTTDTGQVLHNNIFENHGGILQKFEDFCLMCYCLEVQSAAGYLLNGGEGDRQLVTLRDEVYVCTIYADSWLCLPY